MLGISKETVHALPEVHYPGRVILIDSAAKARDAVAYLLKQPQIGFDTETRPSFQKNHRYKVSLVQLSVPGECFLFRLKQIGSLDGLMSIFENPAIQKIGLSLKDDFHSLAKLCEFTPAGFVELQTFVKEYEIADNSLQKIYALIFGQRISKNQRLTNWEATELTPGQQAYAAIDAWACVEIYNHLLAGKFHPEECPYKIDDETARMLQNSVGIHLPLKTSDAEDSASSETPSLAIMESTAINGTPVKRRRRTSAGKSTSRGAKSAAKSGNSSDKPKAKRKTAGAKTPTKAKAATATKKSASPEKSADAKPKAAKAKTTKTKATKSLSAKSKAVKPKTDKAAAKAGETKTAGTAKTAKTTAKKAPAKTAAAKTVSTARRKTSRGTAVRTPGKKKEE